MKRIMCQFWLSIVAFLLLSTLMSFMFFTNPEAKRAVIGSVVPPVEVEPLSPALTSTGDFLGFYTTLSTASPPVPLNIDVVSFPAMNGAQTTISAAWNSYSFLQTDAFLPTNGTTYDPFQKEMVSFISGELQYLQYKDTPMSGNMGPMTFPVSAPVFLNGQYLAILVEDGGYATPPMLEADLVVFDPNFGNFSSLQHLQTTTPNPFTYFTHESMSSATNRVDELYFLSGTHLVIVTDFSIFTPHYCWIDLEPSNSSNNYHSFYGVEYKSPGTLLALRETFINNTPHLDLVEIYFNSTTCTVTSIVNIYDLQSNIPIAPGGWIINSEYYSTTYDTCSSSYYISSLYDAVTSSRLIEIDISNSSHIEQILPQYLFGIEWKQQSCPCEASFVRQQFNSCSNFTFVNTSTGSGPMTCHWDFGDPNSGTNNTSVQCVEMHQFSACGTYNVCLTINANGCMETICQLITVTDITPPVALCKNNVVLALNANCIANVTPTDIDAGSFDDCSLSLYEVTPNSFSQCGTFPVTLTVTDWCGNIGVCTTIISVVDNVPPVIVCPAGVTLSSDSKNCNTIVNGIRWLSFSDNCGVSSVIYNITGASTYSGVGDASGLAFNAGLSVVTYTAFDICGNSSSCSFEVLLIFSCTCAQNLLQNPGFSIGAIPGVLGGNGQSSNWKRGGSNARVYTADFCCDPAALELWGTTYNYGSPVYQEGVTFLAGHQYKVSFCSRWKTSALVNGHLRFGFTATNTPISNSFSVYNCSNCENIGNSTSINSICWETYTLPIWTPFQNYDVLFVRPFSVNSGQPYGYIDNICIEEVFYSCCADQEAFNDNAGRVVSILINQSEEEVFFETGNLLECNRIAYIDWGDGTEIVQGPIDQNSSLTHVYPDTNVYEIQYLVQEFNTEDTSQVCFEKVFSQFVQIEPDSCFCNAFSSLFIRSTNGGNSMPVACQGPSISLSCPPVGSGFSFTGLFGCTGTTCQDTSAISWILSGPQNIEVGQASTNPYFSIDLLPTYFSIPGIYTLTLSGLCGNEVCDCEIQFIVDCQQLCPCASEDVEAFEAAVNRGFTKTIFNNSCNVCFTPNALSDCETATWFLNDTTGSPLGYTYGNETFCYTFPGPDEYSIIMQVDREEAVLVACQTYSYEEAITVNCFIEESCNDDLILNPSFNEGAIAGNMSTDGSTDQWTAITGSPILLNGSAGSSDGWTIQLTGNLSVADVLATTDPICFPKGRGKVTGKNKVEHWGDPHENLNGKHLKDWKGKLFLYLGNEFELGNCPSNSCYEIASIDLSKVDTGWFDFQVEYNLDLWTTALTCIVPGMAEEGIEARLAIFVTSPYTPEQGEPASRARMQIDHLCFSDFVVSIPVVDKLLPLRIYPNPNQSELVVELPGPALQFTTLRIISLTGDVLNEISVSSGTGVQFMNTEYLTTGMYFLQFVSNGQVTSINKFVKL